jgi:GNAT superfamily N-acetyltransferase
MHFHPLLDTAALPRIGIWEDDGSIAGVVNFEHKLGLTYFQVHPEYNRLKPEMLAYAEKNLTGTREDGQKYAGAYINDFDPEFQVVAEEQGYRKSSDYSECMSELAIPNPFPETAVSEGFRIISLAERDDLYLTNRLIHRGFNHPGEPPETGPEERRMMQSAPNFDKNLNIIVAADNGDYCVYAGLWYEAESRLAYVEPVCTDPEYRRRGLATAAIREGIRRCGELGATVAFVAANTPFILPWVSKFYTISISG